jgi:type VI secretion system protein ImpA
MRNASLREPVSAEAPSGPDLDENGDAAYADYTTLAGSRLPERFFSKEGSGSDREVPFDRGRIDIEAETRQVNELLERTRDVRLLLFEARFQALSGSFRGFADCLQDVAELVDVFWDSFHPALDGDDFSRRQNALEELESQVQVILPLTYAPLVGSGGAAVSYRSYMVATGKARPRTDEPVPTIDEVMEALASSRNTEQATTVGNALQDCTAALAAIRNTFITRAGHGSAPDVERLTKLLTEIAALLGEVRPDIAPTQDGATATAGGGLSAEPAGQHPSLGAVQIGSQFEAAAALQAAERYFQFREPSAPALILIHQARMLYGKPLVTALEALLPETAVNAVLRFEGGLRFDIGLGQMKLVTEDVALTEPTPPVEDEDAPVIEFSAETRNDAASLMLGVEAYYRSVEPSSPIPMLLTKARSYLNKDFSAILNELLPRETP